MKEMVMLRARKLLPCKGRWQPTWADGGVTTPALSPLRHACAFGAVHPERSRGGAPPPPRGEELHPNGFSLVELMVVIFIIGLLATVVLINAEN